VDVKIPVLQFAETGDTGNAPHGQDLHVADEDEEADMTMGADDAYMRRSASPALPADVDMGAPVEETSPSDTAPVSQAQGRTTVRRVRLLVSEPPKQDEQGSDVVTAPKKKKKTVHF